MRTSKEWAELLEQSANSYAERHNGQDPMCTLAMVGCLLASRLERRAADFEERATDFDREVLAPDDSIQPRISSKKGPRK